MEFTVNTELFEKAIISPDEWDKFKKWLGDKQFPGGIRVRMYDRFTNAQQGKIFRDMAGVAKLFDLSVNNFYAILKRRDALKHVFTKQITYEFKGKEYAETVENGISKWSKVECNENIEILLPYLEEAVQRAYQERVVFNWSSRENHEKELPMFEFTGEPYVEA